MKNLEIAQIFRDISDILEIKGENRFRIRAYERAAQNIEGLTENIEDYARQGRLREIPGIGEDLSRKIEEYLSKGKIEFYEDLKKSIPTGLLDLIKIPSVGPKTAKLLSETLKIKDISGLESAIKQGKLKNIFGIKEKTVENISKGIELVKKGKERMTLAQAVQVSGEFVGALQKLPEVKRIVCAGSLRRRKETVRDIDILIISNHPQKIMDAFVRLPPVKEILAKGETKSAVRTRDDIQVDCRVEQEKSFGAALLYFTGSKNFNIKLRTIAIKKGLKINEYGVFRGDKYVAGRTEEEIFKLLGMPYVEPELREDTGEIELAKQNRLPELIRLTDIKGDLHVHSTWSDGGNSIEEMVRSCREIGYEYVAITDHSQGLRVANGLSIADLKKKKRQIDGLNKKIRGFRILFGTEVDIDTNGDLDYPEGVLREFDVVVAAVHSGFKQSREQITRRIIRACKNKNVDIIAHPTGRLWGAREAYQVDLEEVFKVAKDTNTFMEINSFPQRLDLNDLHSRLAKEMGVRLSIDTDAHTTEQLNAMGLGVAVARRGWLEKKDVINTLGIEEFLKVIKK